MNRIYAGKWYFYPDRKRPVLITTTGSDITTTGSDFSWGCYVDEEGKERSVPADYLEPMPWDEWYVWPGEDVAEPWKDVSWHDLAVLGEGVISPVTAYNRWSELAQGKQYERALREVQAWLEDVAAVRRSLSNREIRTMCRDHFREFGEQPIPHPFGVGDCVRSVRSSTAPIFTVSKLGRDDDGRPTIYLGTSSTSHYASDYMLVEFEVGDRVKLGDGKSIGTVKGWSEQYPGSLRVHWDGGQTLSYKPEQLRWVEESDLLHATGSDLDRIGALVNVYRPAETLQQLTAAIYNLLPQCPENTVHVYDGVDPATVDIVVRTDEVDALEINDVLCDVGIMGIRYRIWDVDAVCDHLSIYGDVSVCRGCGNVTFMVKKGLLQMRAGYAVQEDRQHWYASLDKVTDNPHFTGRTLEAAVDQAMAKFVELVVDSLPGA